MQGEQSTGVCLVGQLCWSEYLHFSCDINCTLSLFMLFIYLRHNFTTELPLWKNTYMTYSAKCMLSLVYFIIEKIFSDMFFFLSLNCKLYLQGEMTNIRMVLIKKQGISIVINVVSNFLLSCEIWLLAERQFLYFTLIFLMK